MCNVCVRVSVCVMCVRRFIRDGICVCVVYKRRHVCAMVYKRWQVCAYMYLMLCVCVCVCVSGSHKMREEVAPVKDHMQLF